MRKIPFVLIMFLLACVSITGCVTTLDTQKASKQNKQAALESNVKLGMNYLQKKDRENALRAFSKAIELDKRSAEAHQGMGVLHQLNGENELAEKSFKKALKSRSDFSEAGIHLSYGKFLLAKNRYQESAKQFEMAASDVSYPSRPNAFYFLGVAEKRLNNIEKAKVAFDRGLNINPRLSGAALELAEIAFTDKDYAASKKYLNNFTQVNKRPNARSLWLSIQIERVFENVDKEASDALALKNLFPYSQEYLLYKQSLKNAK